jgi:hypothetical protein
VTERDDSAPQTLALQSGECAPQEQEGASVSAAERPAVVDRPTAFVVVGIE